MKIVADFHVLKYTITRNKYNFAQTIQETATNVHNFDSCYIHDSNTIKQTVLTYKSLLALYIIVCKTQVYT